MKIKIFYLLIILLHVCSINGQVEALNFSIVLDMSQMSSSQKERGLEITKHIHKTFIESSRANFPFQNWAISWIDPNHTFDNLVECNIDFEQYKEGFGNMALKFDYKGGSYNVIGVQNKILRNDEYINILESTYKTVYAGGGSNIYDVIRNKKNQLVKPTCRNIIFIISDGEICHTSSISAAHKGKVSCLTNGNLTTKSFKSKLPDFELNESGLKNYFDDSGFGLVPGGSFRDSTVVVLLELGDWNSNVEGEKVLSWVYSDWFHAMNINKSDIYYSYYDDDLPVVFKLIESLIK